ncbi:hypothetical protein [Stenotrophomonas sp. YIM B06876]|uniref:hypothetical protein n=1 Tax=Stenotrophomonas sp. YIM B06876 TaxID=3060211 RepID=UPI00273A5486|nr:hypothetical protein [Stenotrophomonas sp. YIM B06876]
MLIALFGQAGSQTSQLTQSSFIFNDMAMLHARASRRMERPLAVLPSHAARRCRRPQPDAHCAHPALHGYYLASTKM